MFGQHFLNMETVIAVAHECIARLHRLLARGVSFGVQFFGSRLTIGVRASWQAGRKWSRCKIRTARAS